MAVITLSKLVDSWIAMNTECSLETCRDAPELVCLNNWQDLRSELLTSNPWWAGYGGGWKDKGAAN
jgi:hypothetical protein